MKRPWTFQFLHGVSFELCFILQMIPKKSWHTACFIPRIRKSVLDDKQSNTCRGLQSSSTGERKGKLRGSVYIFYFEKKDK